MTQSTLLRRSRGAFTLVELLVSTAIISLIMLVLLSMTNQTTQTWQYTTEKVEKFQEARDGFESMTRRLSQATLNTYWDYLGIVPPNTTTIAPRAKDISSTDYKKFIPLYYGRMSELRFICGPMAQGNWLGGSLPATVNATSTPYFLVPGGPPAGKYFTGQGVFFAAPQGLVEDPNYEELNNLLNVWGYFLEVGPDTNRPAFVDTVTPNRFRSRLMEYSQRSESMTLHDTPYGETSTGWFTVPLKSTDPNNPRPVRVLAENIIALFVQPKLSPQDEADRKSKNQYTTLSPNFMYDSTRLINPGVPISATTATLDPAGLNPKNQLPAIVQVIMVALDDRSVQRLVDKYGQIPSFGLDQAASKVSLTTPFKDLFTDSTKMESGFTVGKKGDLYDLEQILVSERLTYRIFNSNVTIRGAKWSRAQTK